MANRLTRIYTRRGDDGHTSLGSGRKVSKHDLRIESLGDIDELNCQIGITLTHMESAGPLGATLSRIQHELFDIGGELAMESAEFQVISERQLSQLEQEIDRINATLPPLKEFILPGGASAVAHMHLARAICRRAERRLVELGEHESVNPEVLAYINRLSDLLFVGARQLGLDTCTEVLWQPAHHRQENDSDE